MSGTATESPDTPLPPATEKSTEKPGGPVSTITSGTDPRIEELRRELDAVEGAMRTGRNIRIGLALLLAAFLGITSYQFMALANKLQSKPNMDQLTKAAQARYEARLPLIQKELTALVDESSPVVTEAFYEQAKKDLPSFADTLKQQRDPLIESLKEPLRKRLYQTYDKVIDGNQKVFEELVPQAAKPGTKERIVANLHKAVDRMIDKYYLGQLEGLTAMLFESWDQFPSSEVTKNDVKIEDALLGNLLELANYKIAAVEAEADGPVQASKTGFQPKPKAPGNDAAKNDKGNGKQVEPTPAEPKAEATKAEPAKTERAAEPGEAKTAGEASQKQP